MPTQSKNTVGSSFFKEQKLVPVPGGSEWIDVGQGYYRTFTRAQETITGYRGPRLPGVMHGCTHSKVKTHGVYSEIQGSATSKTVGTLPIGVSSDAMGGYVTLTCDYVLSDTDKAELISLLAGEVPPIVSVPNMILELAPTLSLWRDLKRPMLDLLHRYQPGGIRQRFRSGSTALLAQQFGLFPLIGDLTTLLTSTKTVHSEVERILKVPYTWTSHKVKLSPRNAVVTASFTKMSYGNMVPEITDKSVNVMLHYKRKNVNTLERSELARKVGNQLYGFNNPLSVLWETTPFSFVGDWFFPIGDYLQELEKSSFHGSMRARQICTTVRAKVYGEITKEVSPYPKGVTALFEGSLFQRTLGLPSSATPFDQLQLPNVKQSVLGTALILQR